ncbi:unnamed protein product [Symbiodinium sp. CCMP2592]|nr:unnamed protein product [Symbiodinium sp. CCMP2592]
MFDAPDSGDGLGMDAPPEQPVKAEPTEPVESPVKGSPGLGLVADLSPAKEKENDVADESMGVESSSASAGVLPAPGGSAGTPTCPLCNLRTAANKSKWCSVCKADVQAARRESQDKGEGEWFRNLLRSGGEPLQDFMHEYVKMNGSARRKYSQRVKFDFLKYKEARRIQTSYKLGYKAVFMAKARAVNHWVEWLNMDRKQALDKWDTEVAAAKVTNQNGPVGSPLQIPVKLDDFIIVEDAVVDEKIKEKEFKRQKFTEEVEGLMDEGLLGRAGSEEDIEKFGLARMDNPDMVSSLFGRPNKIAVVNEPAAEAEKEPKEKENRKSFDAATEKLALQNKLNQMLDKEATALAHVVEEVAAFMDESFDAAFASTETPLNELAAMKLLRARRFVARALLGSYAPGRAQTDDPAKGQEDADQYEAVLKCNPEAELPESFLQMQPLLHISQKLGTSLKTLATPAERKSIETDFKPVVNIISLMRTSLKSALDKTKKFSKDRLARVERVKRQQDQQAVKAIDKEKKKREQEAQKINKAAEKQGRVDNIFGIDLLKLGIRALAHHTLEKAEDVKGLNFSKPFLLNAESPALSQIQAACQDQQIKTSMDSFYNGFPGSAASLKGSKRFTALIKDTAPLRAKILENLEIPVRPPPRDADSTMVTALQGVYSWAYGEEMLSTGSFEASQLPTIRIQTQGHRWLIFVSLDSLVSYIRSCRRGAPVAHADVIECMQSMQPHTMAAFLSMHPDAVQHGLVTKGSITFLPAAWLVAEKAGVWGSCSVNALLRSVLMWPELVAFVRQVINMRCAFGLRVQFLPDLDASDKNMEVLATWSSSAASLGGLYKQKHSSDVKKAEAQ